MPAGGRTVMIRLKLPVERFAGARDGLLVRAQ
jgi:hypothetical protein